MSRKFEIVLKVLLGLLFIGCLFDMPYFYYQFVRVVGMTGFAILAYLDWKNENKIFAIIWLCSALIINPIVKIPLGRFLWNVLDVIWTILMFVSYYVKKGQEKNDGTTSNF